MMTIQKRVLASVLALVWAANTAWAADREEGFLGLETGQTVHYIANGKQGKKPLLLFLHGAPERAEVWEDYMRAFKKDYYTVAFNSRGYFPSTIPQNVADYSVGAMAADVVAVAKALGYDSFTLVGHDWGAATAWRTAIAYPNAVERLVIFSNPHPLMYARAYHESAAHKVLIDAYIPLARSDVAPWSREGTLANNFDHFKNYVYTEAAQKALPWSMGLLLEETWGHDEGASLAAIYNHYKALDWPLTTLATCNPVPTFSLTTHQPTLVMYGDADRFVSAEAYSLPNNDCTPNADYVAIEGGDHFIHHTHKRFAIAQIKDFLRDKAAKKD